MATVSSPTTTIMSANTIRLAMAVRQSLATLPDHAGIAVRPAPSGNDGVVIDDRYHLAAIHVQTARAAAGGTAAAMIAGWRVSRLDYGRLERLNESALIVAEFPGFGDAMQAIIGELAARRAQSARPYLPGQG